MAIVMASMTVRSTFAFDPVTAQRLEHLAKRWGLSKSEVLRRVIASAESGSLPLGQREIPSTPLEAFRRIQTADILPPGTAAQWQAELAEERAQEA